MLRTMTAGSSVKESYTSLQWHTFANDPKLDYLALVILGFLCMNVEQSPLWNIQRFGHDICKMSPEKKGKTSAKLLG